MNSESSDTERLLELVGVGDDDATEQLFERYRTRLHRIIDARMNDQLRARVDPSNVIKSDLRARLLQAIERMEATDREMLIMRHLASVGLSIGARET